MKKEIKVENKELVISIITTKKQVFTSFSYPFGDVEFYRKMRDTPRCYKCTNVIKKTMAIGFARKGSNRIFCLSCIKELEKQGLEIQNVKKKT